jgi:hypothetical protein
MSDLNNSKGMLNSLCLNISNDTSKQPKYTVISEHGPPHAKMFTVKLEAMDLTSIKIATTKKQAEKMAAEEIYLQLKKFSPIRTRDRLSIISILMTEKVTNVVTIVQSMSRERLNAVNLILSLDDDIDENELYFTDASITSMHQSGLTDSRGWDTFVDTFEQECYSFGLEFRYVKEKQIFIFNRVDETRTLIDNSPIINSDNHLKIQLWERNYNCIELRGRVEDFKNKDTFVWDATDYDNFSLPVHDWRTQQGEGFSAAFRAGILRSDYNTVEMIKYIGRPEKIVDGIEFTNSEGMVLNTLESDARFTNHALFSELSNILRHMDDTGISTLVVNHRSFANCFEYEALKMLVQIAIGIKSLNVVFLDTIILGAPECETIAKVNPRLIDDDDEHVSLSYEALMQSIDNITEHYKGLFITIEIDAVMDVLVLEQLIREYQKEREQYIVNLRIKQ